MKERKTVGNITIVSTNEQKPNTCGICKHTDNNLGIVALHCRLLFIEQQEEMQTDDRIIADGKVRSWDKCIFEPSRYEKR